SSAAGRTRSKLISTITSVPPARGSAPGLAALTASASDQVAGRKNSMTHSTAGSTAPGQAQNHRIGGGEERLVCAFLQGSVNVIMGSRPQDPVRPVIWDCCRLGGVTSMILKDFP